MIDKLLEFYVFRPERFNIDTSGNLAQVHHKALLKMRAYDLIIPSGKLGFHLITQKGHEAYKMGGFDAWLAANEKKDKEVHQAILDTATATVDAADSARLSTKSAKDSYRLSVIIGLISIIPIGLNIWQFFDSRNKDEKIDSLSKRITSLESNTKPTTASIQLPKSNQRKSPGPVHSQPTSKKAN